MRNFVLLLFCYVLLFTHLSCKKNDTPKPLNDDPLIENARNYFEQFVLPGSTIQRAIPINQLSPRNDSRMPVWDKSYTINFSGKKAVISPVHYNNPFVEGCNPG